MLNVLFKGFSQNKQFTLKVNASVYHFLDKNCLHQSFNYQGLKESLRSRIFASHLFIYMHEVGMTDSHRNLTKGGYFRIVGRSVIFLNFLLAYLLFYNKHVLFAKRFQS